MKNGTVTAPFYGTLPAGGEDGPTYKCPAYQKNAPVYEYLWNIFYGGWQERDATGLLEDTPKARLYLPPETKEDARDWLIRYRSTPYQDKYRQKIEKFAALCFSNGLELRDTPALIWLDRAKVPAQEYAQVKPFWDDIDGKGTHGDRFCYQMAVNALVFGISFTFVEWSATSTVRTLRDAIKQGLRPYWVHIDPRDIINWQTTKVQGKDLLTQVTICRTEYKLDAPKYQTKNNVFKEKEVKTYRVYKLTPQGVLWEKYVQKEGNKDEAEETPESTGFYDISYIPLFPCYGGMPESWGCCSPVLKALAESCHLYYKMSSDLYRYIHLTCVPVLQISDDGEGSGQVVLSPAVPYVQKGMGTGLRWVELTGSCLQQLRVELNNLDAGMDILAESWMRNPTDNQTAFATAVQATATDSGLEIFARQLMSAINLCLKATSDLMKVPFDGYCVINAGISKRVGNDNEKFRILKEMRADGTLTTETYLTLVKHMGYFPDTFNPVEEAMKAIAAMPKAPAPIDSFAVESLKNLLEYSCMTKRQLLQELMSRGVLTEAFSIDEAIRETGEHVAVIRAGSGQVVQPATPEAIAAQREVEAIRFNREYK